jgi:hypothetical protein
MNQVNERYMNLSINEMYNMIMDIAKESEFPLNKVRVLTKNNIFESPNLLSLIDDEEPIFASFLDENNLLLAGAWIFNKNGKYFLLPDDDANELTI